MSENINLNLFPKKEEWATGDEALDLRLTLKLKEVTSNLTIESCRDFYLFGTSLKTRAFNPLFKINIELVTKALLANIDSKSLNDDEFKKLKGHYHLKNKINFDLEKSDIVIEGLRMLKKFRYENQIDFFIEEQMESDRNPYVDFEIKKAKYSLFTKAIFKDLTRTLAGELKNDTNIPFVEGMLSGINVLVIKGLGEFWFDVDQIYSISLL